MNPFPPEVLGSTFVNPCEGLGRQVVVKALVSQPAELAPFPEPKQVVPRRTGTGAKRFPPSLEPVNLAGHAARAGAVNLGLQLGLFLDGELQAP